MTGGAVGITGNSAATDATLFPPAADTFTGTGGIEPEPKETQTADLVRGPSPTPAPIRTSMEDQASLRMRENADKANPDQATPMSPSKEVSKVKTWLRSKLSTRRKSRSEKPTTKEKSEKPITKESESIVHSSQSAGAALDTSSTHDQSTLTMDRRSSSDRDVALAGKGKEVMRDDDASSVSSLNSSDSDEEMLASERADKRDSIMSKTKSATDDEEDEFSEARDNFDEDLIPVPTFPSERKESPARDSKFKEEI